MLHLPYLRASTQHQWFQIDLEVKQTCAMSDSIQEHTFHLQGKEYIELNKLLKRLNLVGTGGEANICIENGDVTVNEVIEYRKRNKLRPGYAVVFGSHKIVIEA